MDQSPQPGPRHPNGIAHTQMWDKAYRKYLRFWINLARTLSLPPEEAKDVVHGVIATILANEKIEFLSIEHLRNYVSKSIVNRAVQTKRRNDRSVPWEEHVELQFAVESDLDALDKKYITDVLREAIRGLPPRDFRTVKLRFFAGLHFSEISALLDAPISTVKSREDHALKIIRKWFSKRGIRGGNR